MTWKVVAIDETSFLTRPIEGVTRVWAVYAYSDGAVFHMCEFEPSYELNFVRHVVDGSLDEERLDELAREFDACMDESITYMHCRAIEKLKASQVVSLNFKPDSESTYAEQCDEVLEYLAGNWVMPTCIGVPEAA